jgi:amino acid transporter
MLALGLILLIVGIVLVALAAVGQPPSAARLAPLGWLLAIIGLILALVAVLVTNDSVGAMLGGGVAMAATPPRHVVSLDQDPPEPVAGSSTCPN